jgi:hypothetical protein
LQRETDERGGAEMAGLDEVVRVWQIGAVMPRTLLSRVGEVAVCIVNLNLGCWDKTKR